MKIWQLISIFRDEKEIIFDVLIKAEWKKYEEIYKNIDYLINNQIREVLDEELPLNLYLEVISKSKMFFYEINESKLISVNKPKDDFKKITILEFYKRFGSDAIEKLLEQGIFVNSN